MVQGFATIRMVKQSWNWMNMVVFVGYDMACITVEPCITP